MRGGFLGRKELPRSEWAKHADRVTLRALDALIDAGAARESDNDLFIPSDAAVRVPGNIADRLDFPPIAGLGLTIALEDRVETPKGRVQLRWTDPGGRLVRPERTGVVLKWGERAGRLSAPLLAIATAAERYNATQGRPLDERVESWMPLQEALCAVTTQDVPRDGFLETFTIYQAGSFALDVHEDARFTPILMGRDQAIDLEDNAPVTGFAGTDEPQAEMADSDVSPPADGLLDDADQRTFAEAFTAAGPARPAYPVGRNRFIVLDPDLRRALDIVKAKQRASPEERREFLRNPRAGLAAKTSLDGQATPTAALFIDTKNYSDRVEGLGLWERPKVPWLVRKPTAWLPEAGWLADGVPVEPPPLTRDELKEFEDAIETAEASGTEHVILRGCPIPIDAAPGELVKERERTEAVYQQATSAETSPGAEPPNNGRVVLLINKTNFDGIDYQIPLRTRPALIPAAPPLDKMASTRLKQHQIEGFKWLIESWRAGLPGVLLADDMGLGKTFQALAFLAWVKSNQVAAARRGNGSVPAGPILIVAPTALLRNWEKECEIHLAPGALGVRVDAYGRQISKLKRVPGLRSDPGETLNVAMLRDADWILTTYETLTDHERSFARIEYSVVLFDEMQKVKAPDTLNTKAVKSLNADFTVGLTGTPIENRLEDIWCLFDRLFPGYLLDLRTFSRTFRESDPERLQDLKARLSEPMDKAPAVMKRRMKDEVLDGLPKKIEHKITAAMPEEQSQAYRELVSEAGASSDRSRGYMLKVLHAMRGLSLHPVNPASIRITTAADFDQYAASSARLATAVNILRDIYAKDEKALIFIENLAMQDVVADGLAALFDLSHRPSIVNGGVAGERRLAIVDRFTERNVGFDVLVLSPKAAGVGLNIVAANHVIHLSRWWNPAVEDQCNDRAYRIGQIRTVNIHVPIATHPDFPGATFDERLDELLTKKRELSRHMLAPPEGEGDIETLFGGAVR
jgi:superfamily II DNA or RNA helicase